MKVIFRDIHKPSTILSFWLDPSHLPKAGDYLTVHPELFLVERLEWQEEGDLTIWVCKSGESASFYRRTRGN